VFVSSEVEIGMAVHVLGLGFMKCIVGYKTWYQRLDIMLLKEFIWGSCNAMISYSLDLVLLISEC
jgi:hypothetical protein